MIQLFFRQVTARSEEHKQSFDLLYHAGHYGVCIGIIRQEIDSMMRVAYLNDPDTPTAKGSGLLLTNLGHFSPFAHPSLSTRAFPV